MNDTQTFIDVLFEPDDIVEFRPIKSNAPIKPIWAYAGQVNGEVNKLDSLNKKGFNIYIGANPRCGFGKKSDKNIHLARSVFVDFDEYDGDCEQIARQRIDAAGLPKPTMITNSGHGIHCYWVLADPIKDMDYWRWLQNALIETLGSDPKPKNPERVMRLPGFKNVKHTPHVNTSIIEADPNRVYYTGEIESNLSNSDPPEPLLDESELPEIAAKLTPEMIATVPIKKDTRRDCQFKFARCLKSEYRVKNAKLFFPLHDQWLEKALPNINHKDKGLNRTQFVAAYNDVKYLIGDSPLARIFEQSKSIELPERVSRELAMYEDENLIILAKFCIALQNENAPKPFFLKQEAAAPLLEVSQQDISDLFKDLLAEGMIKVVSDYIRPTTKNKGKAKSYRWM